MRVRTYGVFAIVAWPAFAWGVCEIGLRALSGQASGIPATAFLTASAAACILGSHLRTRQLQAAEARQ